MVGPHGGGRPAARERDGRALVGLQPPGREDPVVDRAAHERMAERERPALPGRRDEARHHEPVEHRRVGRDAGRGGSELGVERVPRDGGALGQRARLDRERGDLLLDGRDDGRREPAGAEAVGRPRELAQEQRAAGGLARQALAQRGGRDVAQHRERRVVADPVERDLLAAGHAAQRVEQPWHGPGGPRRERDQVPHGRRPAQQVQDELDRGLVGPVQVVEQQDDRAPAAEQLEQRAGGAVQVEALGRAHAGRAQARQAAEAGRHGIDRPRRQIVNVGQHRGVGEAERHVALVLDAAALDDHEALRPLGDRRQQGALADPGLPGDPEHAPAAAPRLFDRAARARQLPIASDQLHRRATTQRVRDLFQARRAG